MQPGKLNVIIDGQWGSTGKGKLAGYLAITEDIDVATCDFQTNAGHFTELDNGERILVQQLPSAVVNPDCMLLINPGASITVEKLLAEVDQYKCHGRLLIHPHAGIISSDMVHAFREHRKKYAGTKKGVSVSLAMKAMRHKEYKLAKDIPVLQEWIGDTTKALHGSLKSGAMCIAEGAQGFDLSLNHGYRYPYVTGRDVTTCQILSNAGVPPQAVGDVYGCIRTYPIRVGSIRSESGEMLEDSGPCYQDQKEISWEQLKELSGSTMDLVELTTVTQRVRRVFTFSHLQFERFVQQCGPTHIFVNFVNHLDAGIYGSGDLDAASPKVASFMTDLIEIWSRSVKTTKRSWQIKYLGTGPRHSQMVTL